MNILLICNKPPFPEADGGSIAMASMVRSILRNGHQLTLLSMVSFKHQAATNDFPEELRDRIDMHFVEVDLRVKPVGAFLNLFTRKSYHVQRFVSKKFEERLTELLKKKSYDIIQMETVFIAPYLDIIKLNSHAKVLLRIHNIEHEVWQRTADQEKNPFRKWYLALLARRLKKYELNVLNELDGLLTIASTDMEKVKAMNLKVPVENIPLGLNLNLYPCELKKEIKQPVLFHLGAMDWIPNQQAIEWFLEKVWGKLIAQFPGLQFHIAGRKMPKRFFEMNSKNLMVQGEIEDAKAFIAAGDIMIVPLLSGSGLRVKIIEGMAMGKCIITTSIGAAGIDCSDEENILIADSAEEFIQKITGVLERPEQIGVIGNNARKLIEEKYSLEIVSRNLEELYQNYLSDGKL